jgi:hypothetical protein
MESSRAPQSNQPQSNGNAAKTVDINSLFAVFDLTGFWLADYGSHGLEILEILQKDNYLIAKKVLTAWRIILRINLLIGEFLKSY